MEKKKMARSLMVTAVLASGLALGQSFYNEAHATNCDQCKVTSGSRIN